MQQPPDQYSQYPQQQWQQPSQPLSPQQQWQQQTNYGQPQSYYPPPPMPPQQQWNPQQPPFQLQQYPQQQWYQQPPKEPKRKWYQRLFAWCRRHPIATAVIIIVFLLIGIIGNATSPQISTDTPTVQATQSAQIVPTAKPTQAAQQPTLQPTQIPTPQSIQYPPRTIADLRGLAAKGDTSAINEFHSESVGLTGVCPQPKREVTVNSSVTGQQLAEDLLAYFYAQQLDNPCGSVVFAYHNQSEGANGYTAGRVNLDVTDSSGATNIDPNATNLKYTLTLDIGDVATGQEYVVTY
jgi:hypothetical protein